MSEVDKMSALRSPPGQMDELTKWNSFDSPPSPCGRGQNVDKMRFAHPSPCGRGQKRGQLLALTPPVDK